MLRETARTLNDYTPDSLQTLTDSDRYDRPIYFADRGCLVEPIERKPLRTQYLRNVVSVVFYCLNGNTASAAVYRTL